MTMTLLAAKIPARQRDFLDRESERLGISTGELLRRIVDRHEERVALAAFRAIPSGGFNGG